MERTESMKTVKTEQSLSVALSTAEAWTLASFFAPGVMFGLQDPAGELTDEERQAREAETLQALVAEGVLQVNEANQYRVDEMIGGMIYSTIHSEHVLVVRNQRSGGSTYYHFLPDWQLCLQPEEERIWLTLFRTRADLLGHILEDGLGEHDGTVVKGFTVRERDLEMAASLHENGSPDRARRLLAEVDIGEVDAFLQAYLAPQLALQLDALYSRQDPEKSAQRRGWLLGLGPVLYWVDREEDPDGRGLLHFQPLGAGGAVEKLNALLPSEG
jgi:hypothetical protein